MKTYLLIAFLGIFTTQTILAVDCSDLSKRLLTPSHHLQTLEAKTGIEEGRLLELKASLRAENFNEISEYTERMKNSAALFELTLEEFIQRLNRSNFTAKEYYERVEYLKNKKKIWEDTSQIAQAFKRLAQDSSSFFIRNFNEYVKLSSEFSELKQLLANAPTAREKTLIAMRFARDIHPQKAKQLYRELSEGFTNSRKALWKSIVQTRLINTPKFERALLINLLADNGSMGIIHLLKVGLEKLDGLVTDLGAFSVIEVILSMTSAKEAALLEAFPELLKKGKEAAENLTEEQIVEVSRFKLLTNSLAKALGRVKDEGFSLIKDGSTLAVQTSLIGALPVFVGNAASGLTGQALVNETIGMSLLIGSFFATSSNIRYQLYYRAVLPLIENVPFFQKNDSALTAAMAIAAGTNITLGTYSWYLYKDCYDYSFKTPEEGEDPLSCFVVPD